MRSRSAILLVIAVSVLAQTPASRDMSIMTGKGELLVFGGDVMRVVVAEPKIACNVAASLAARTCFKRCT